MPKKLGTFDSEKLPYAQAQLLAVVVNQLDPEQELMHLAREIHSWRGTIVVDELCLDLVTLIPRILRHINAEDLGDAA